MEQLSKQYDLTTVDGFKDYLYDKIDKNTNDTILNGFTFDGKTFSMSVVAQINWSNLLNVPEGMFPVNVSTTSNELYILTYANVQAFYGAALMYKSVALQSGTVLKNTVHNCTTIEELETILNSL
jgi:hypothetical protein